jgi:hypothetical protein
LYHHISIPLISIQFNFIQMPADVRLSLVLYSRSPFFFDPPRFLYRLSESALPEELEERDDLEEALLADPDLEPELPDLDPDLE